MPTQIVADGRSANSSVRAVRDAIVDHVRTHLAASCFVRVNDHSINIMGQSHSDVTLVYVEIGVSGLSLWKQILAIAPAHIYAYTDPQTFARITTDISAVVYNAIEPRWWRWTHRLCNYVNWLAISMQRAIAAMWQRFCP